MNTREANHNARTFRFDNFPKFQKDISDKQLPPSPDPTHEWHFSTLPTK